MTGYTLVSRQFSYTGHVEWLLQVADEIDDALSAAHHCIERSGAEVRLAGAGLLASGCVAGAVLHGANLTLLTAGSTVLIAATYLKSSAARPH